MYQNTIAIAFIALVAVGACSPTTPTAPVVTATLVQSPTATQTHAPTDTPTPASSPTRTQVPTRTPTPTATLPPPNPALPLLTVRVQAIQVMDDDGKRVTPITPPQVKQWLYYANAAWAAGGIQFFFDPTTDFTTLKSTFLNNLTLAADENFSERTQFGNQVAARYPGKLVTIFHHSPSSDPTNKGGFSGTRLDFVVMPAFDTWLCGRGKHNTDMFPHEIGHFLGLAHTHAHTFKSRQEAETYLMEHNNDPKSFDGDGLSDTPPDPYISPEMGCGTETLLTLNNIVFTLPRTNLMSYYYYGNQPGVLSPQQIERARWYFAWRAKNGMARPVNANVSGAIEFESLPVKAATNLAAKEQKLSSTQADWSNDRQLFCRAYENSLVTFAVTVDKPGRYALNLYATHAPGYGLIQTFVDGKPLGAPIDLFGYGVVPTGKILVGELDLTAGAHDLEFRVVGKNERSTGFAFGLDAFQLLVKP